jgi:hypothetical protein
MNELCLLLTLRIAYIGRCLLVEHLFPDRARVEVYFGFEAHGLPIPSQFQHPMANVISASPTPRSTIAPSHGNVLGPSSAAMLKMPFDAAPGPVISEAALYDATLPSDMLDPTSTTSANEEKEVVEDGGKQYSGTNGLEAPLGDINIAGDVSLFDGVLNDEVWFDSLLNWVDAPDDANGSGAGGH